MEEYPSWLKGLVLKTSRSCKRRQGSNPYSSAISYLYIAEQSSLVAREAHNLEVIGSNPFSATKWFVSLEAYDACLSRRRPRVRIPYEPPFMASQLSRQSRGLKILVSLVQFPLEPPVSDFNPINWVFLYNRNFIRKLVNLLHIKIIDEVCVFKI